MKEKIGQKSDEFQTANNGQTLQCECCGPLVYALEVGICIPCIPMLTPFVRALCILGCLCISVHTSSFSIVASFLPRF